MSLSTIDQIKVWLEENEISLLDNMKSFLKIPSVESESEPNAPYGLPVRKALDFMLDLGREWDMKVKDLDGHIGYAEFGQGKDLIVAIGHLDVVPPGSGWSHDPFGAEIKDGYLYARGVVDDKGPTLAAFYAARAIQQIFPEIPARIRCIFGCNEESGFNCIHYYNKHEEPPTYGFTPDADWPVIYAEKGIISFLISVPKISQPFALLEIKGGERLNMVMDTCTATVQVLPEAKAEVEESLKQAWDKNILWSWKENYLSIKSTGKSAHASEPFMGDSAGIRCLRFLYEISPISTKNFYENLLELCQLNGAGLGAAGVDDLSHLTCNLGVISTEGDSHQFFFNIRYPVTWKGEQVHQYCARYFKENNLPYSLKVLEDSPPLYYPKEHPLIQTACKVYEAETGYSLEPKVIGGGTYARALSNTVTIGTNWEGDGPIHAPDERMKVTHFLKLSKIYAHILYKLATNN